MCLYTGSTYLALKFWVTCKNLRLETICTDLKLSEIFKNEIKATLRDEFTLKIRCKDEKNCYKSKTKSSKNKLTRNPGILIILSPPSVSHSVTNLPFPPVAATDPDAEKSPARIVSEP